MQRWLSRSMAAGGWFRTIAIGLAFILSWSGAVFASGQLSTWYSVGTNATAQSPTKTQTGPALLYSNSPEWLTFDDPSTGTKGSIGDGSVASDLAYVQNLSAGTYRIFASHTNKTGGDAVIGVVVNGKGRATVTKKGVSISRRGDYAAQGMDAATSFFESTGGDYVDVDGEWMLLEPVPTIPNDQSATLIYEVTLSGTDTWAMAVTAARSGLDLQGQWRDPSVTLNDARAHCTSSEFTTQRGLFQGVKTIGTPADPVVYDFSDKPSGFAYRDQIGHPKGSQANPSRDHGFDDNGNASDGWVGTAPAGGYGTCGFPVDGTNQYFIAGNYGVEYQYNIKFTGGHPGQRVEVFFGPGYGTAGLNRMYGLAVKVGDLVWAEGPVNCSESAFAKTPCSQAGYNPAEATFGPDGTATLAMSVMQVANTYTSNYVWYRLH